MWIETNEWLLVEKLEPMQRLLQNPCPCSGYCLHRSQVISSSNIRGLSQDWAIKACQRRGDSRESHHSWCPRCLWNKGSFFWATQSMSPPLTLHYWCRTESEIIVIPCFSSANCCCYYRYKKPFLTGWLSVQPGLGIKLEKSLVFKALVDFTAAPKSWLGVIQLNKDCVRCS
jgi:hypothetical protein